jgi:glyoxylase-like metal-dependent hydrolase (beta-lactamase superfamily II)
VKKSLIIVSLLVTTSLLAQDDMSKVEVKSEQITPSIYMLTGQGGNIGVIAGDDGVVMIDDQYAPLTPKIQAALKTISDKPLRFLINTHWHGDHTGGNENLGNSGVVIVAHENVRKRMSSEQFIEFFNEKIPPSPRAALPIVTFGDGVTFHVNGQTMQVWHVANAHTDGDSIILFTEANVVHTGDVFFNGFYPFIDTASGGSIDGMILGCDSILKNVNATTRIVPGHGPLGSAADLRAFRDMLVTARERVSKLVRAGKTVEQVVAANPLQELDAKWGKGFLKTETFTRMLYDELATSRKTTAKE